MDDFKIKSIEEFDNDFVAMLNQKSNVDISSDSNGAIPEIAKDEPQPIESVQPIYTAPEQPTAPDAQNEVVYSPVAPAVQAPVAPAPVQKAPDKPINNKQPASVKEKKKQSGLAVAGKIFSIIMLISTVLVFILGCVAITFVDNSGANIGGICINTASADVIDDSGKLYIGKGDLMFSKIGTPADYNVKELVIVKSASPESSGRCDVMLINAVTSTSDDEAVLLVTNRTQNSLNLETVSSNSTYGVYSKVRIPLLGDALHFVFDSTLNSVLVCVLFVLMISMWCLMIILINNHSKKKPEDKKSK